MCGIAAVVGTDQQDAKSKIRAMMSHLKHRGPDASGFANFDTVALGNTRLAMQDPGKKANQPMQGKSNDWTLVYNGEIFNHHALRKRMGRTDWKTKSDTETLLFGLMEFGPEFIKLIDGFFAFVAYHKPSERLLIARDRLGVKPLYIGQVNHALWIASELKPIIKAGFEQHVDPTILLDSLLHRWSNGKQTPIKGIERYEPGCYSWICINSLERTTTKWYTIQDSIKASLYRYYNSLTTSEVQEILHERLKASVVNRSLSDAPVGVMCSGGLDSSLITALFAKQSSKKLTAFSATFPNQPEVDESIYAATVCKAVGVNYVPVPIEKKDWKDKFVSCVEHFGYPLVHESSIALSILGQKVNSLGYKALLSGEGADELFGGYGSRHIQLRHNYDDRWRQPSELSIPSSDHWVTYLNTPEESNTVVTEKKRIHELVKHLDFLPPQERMLKAAVLSDLTNFLSHGLNRLDKNMMQESIEIREPFLSNSVVDFAINLPLDFSIKPELKACLKNMATPYLPKSIIERNKVGFSYACDDILKDVNPEFLNTALLRDVFQVSKENWASLTLSLTGRSLMRFLSAEAWLQCLISGRNSHDVSNSLWAC